MVARDRAQRDTDDEAPLLYWTPIVQGETLGEISRELAISLEQTKYRLRRAHVALRRVLLNQYATLEVPE